MKYFGMPMGMWTLFAGSFQRKLMDEFGYDAATAKDIAKKAKPRYRQIIANDKKPSAHADGFRLSKKSAGRKSAFTQKGVCESFSRENSHFFETHAFAVCVNRPLTCKLWRER